MSDDAEQTEEKRDAPRAGVRGCAPLLFFMALVVAAAWGACLGVFVWILEDAEETLKALDDFRPKIGSKVYSSDAEQLAEFTIEARQLISLNEMPLILQKAFIATEDDTFYGHKGVRPLAVVSAAVDALRTGNMRGASTITQQIVRNIEKTGITKEVTISRKLREMVVSLQMEREFTKDEILEMYLNQIFLGVSAYGVEAACRQYFMKSASELTLGECAMLAGLTRSPNRNNPFRSPENARARRDIVLRQMYINGLITEAEREAAVAESVDDSVITREERAVLLASRPEVQPADLQLADIPAAATAVTAPAGLANMTLEDAERWLIEQALAKHDGLAEACAQALGLSRSAYYRRLEKYGLST